MTAVTALNKFVNFERRSKVFSDITSKSFVRIPWLCTLYCVTLGVFSRKKPKYMEYITVTFLWKMFLVPYRTEPQSLSTTDMAAVTTWNKFLYFERSSQVFSEITRKSFVRNRDSAPFTVWPVESLVVQNIYAWNILELLFCEKCSLCLLTTLVWM